MASAPFEQFINKFLKQHDALDLLRQVANNNPEHHTKLVSVVDRILLENYMEQYCIREGYATVEHRNVIHSKLHFLKTKLTSKNVPIDSIYCVIVEIAIYFVDSGCALSKDLLIYLNKINNVYE